MVDSAGSLAGRVVVIAGASSAAGRAAATRLTGDSATVVALAAAPRVAAAVAAVEPQFYHYQLLKQALAHYRALLPDPTLTQLPSPGKQTLHADDAYPGAAALRRLLLAEGDLVPPATAPSDASGDSRLDADLVAALKHYQDRHGLEPDGLRAVALFP